MVPSSVGKPFKDAPGTFIEGMEGRTTEIGMGMMGLKVMKMSRTQMIKGSAPHNKGITWEKFAEHRGYALPGYVPKHPKVSRIEEGRRPVPSLPPAYVSSVRDRSATSLLTARSSPSTVVSLARFSPRHASWP